MIFVTYARRAAAALKWVALPMTLALAMAAQPTWAIPERSRAVRAEFMRTHPCPANGKTRGACPGWQVDHVTPLKCGGPDAAANMQWLTVQAHKDKTRVEAKDCRRRNEARSTA